MNTARRHGALGVALLLVSTAGCGGERAPRPARPDGSAVWVAPASSALGGEDARVLAAAGVEEVFLDAATVEWRADGPELRTAWGAFEAVPSATPVTVVARAAAPAPTEGIDLAAAGRRLGGDLRDLALAAEERGLLPLGVHLEIDGESAPPAELLRAVRSALGPELLLSTSIPRRALRSDGAAEAARAVDFVVSFLHGQPSGAPDDPATWDPERAREDLAALDSLGADYVVGFHVVGSAWRLGASGERVEEAVSTRTDLKALALDPALRLDIDPFAGDGRLLYTFQAQAPTRIGDGVGQWRLAPGESIRVSRSAPAFARLLLADLAARGASGEGSEGSRYTGALFHRAAEGDELLAFDASEMAAALGAEPGVPDLAWRIVVKSRQSGSVRMEIELVNRGRQGTDLATTEGNYLEVKTRNGHFVAVEPGDFSRYSLWRGDQEARPGIGWREPDGVRLATPMVHGGERLGGAILTLRGGGPSPRISVAGQFVLTGGEILELPVVEGVLESSLGGPIPAAATAGGQ